MKPSVLVIGSGAMGVLFAALLSDSGIQVNLFDEWEEGIQALRHNGARYYDQLGILHTAPVNAFLSPEEIPSIHCALVLVKSWQTEKASLVLERVLSQEGICITLQNGLGNYETLASRLGTEKTTAGVTTIGSTLLSPGLVQFHGAKSIVVGNHPRIKYIMSILSHSGFHVLIEDNLDSILWGKLIVNAAINPLTTIMEMKNGDLLHHPHLENLMDKIIHESSILAAKLGINLPYEDPFMYVREIIKQTSGNTSSMLQDWLRGTDTEIDAITGKIISYGQMSDTPTPYNEAVYDLLKTRIQMRHSLCSQEKTT